MPGRSWRLEGTKFLVSNKHMVYIKSLLTLELLRLGNWNCSNCSGLYPTNLPTNDAEAQNHRISSKLSNSYIKISAHQKVFNLFFMWDDWNLRRSKQIQGVALTNGYAYSLFKRSFVRTIGLYHQNLLSCRRKNSCTACNDESFQNRRTRQRRISSHHPSKDPRPCTTTAKFHLQLWSLLCYHAIQKT